MTVVNYRNLPKAEILADSFLQHHRDTRFFIVVLDYPTRIALREKQDVSYVRASTLHGLTHNFFQLAVALNEVELSKYVTSVATRQIAREYGDVVFLSHESLVLGSLEELTDAVKDHDLVMVPRRLTPLPDNDLEPSPVFIWDDPFDSGVFSVNAERTEFVDWWVERASPKLQFEATCDYRFLLEANILFDAHLLRDPGYGVAFWNLDERSVRNSSDMWFSNDRPLRTVYFNGFEPSEPFWLSKYLSENPRNSLENFDHIGDLYLDYADELAKRGDFTSLSDDPARSYGWHDFLPGLALTGGIRHIYRTELLAGKEKSHVPSPFVSGQLEEFIEWLGTTTTLSGPAVQNFLLATFVDRPDLYASFVRGNHVDFEGLMTWVRDHGRAECPVTRVVTITPPLRREVDDKGRSREGVDVIGSLNSEHGLGEAGRLLVDALRATSIKISTVSYIPVGVRDNHPFVADQISTNRTTIVALNPEQTRDVWNMYGSKFREGRYVIGQWFWELEIAPPWYKPAFGEGLVDELWAPTKFIETMLRNSAPHHIPIHYMPLPFTMPEVDDQFSLGDLGLPERYSFLFTFDFGSVMKRKNPDAVILAFRQAFEDGEGPQLIIKSINGAKRPREYARLKWLCGNRSDIHLIDAYFDSDTNSALIANCDCYVSLHRSEGLGLTLAEAMLLGKPVITTAYSGNMDFVNHDTGFLVPWQYVKVGEGAAAYPKYAQWADPDINFAADCMRELYAQPDVGREVGARARRYIEQEFSPAVTGERMAQRIRDIKG